MSVRLFFFGGSAADGTGGTIAEQVLEDGRAWRKFQHICEAQGGMRTPKVAPHCRPIVAAQAGLISTIDNRRLARVAKLAGAPDAKAAGVEIHVRLGDEVGTREPLYTVHAEAPDELAYSLEYVAANEDIIRLAEE